jgi:hypothetical protein
MGFPRLRAIAAGQDHRHCNAASAHFGGDVQIAFDHVVQTQLQRRQRIVGQHIGPGVVDDKLRLKTIQRCRQFSM